MQRLKFIPAKYLQEYRERQPITLLKQFNKLKHILKEIKKSLQEMIEDFDKEELEFSINSDFVEELKDLS